MGDIMKQTTRTKIFFKAAVAVVIAVAFLVPTTVLANQEKTNVSNSIPHVDINLSDWMMKAENVSGTAGMNYTFNFIGTWAEPIAAYTFGIRYDASRITFVSISLVGTVAEFEVEPGDIERWSLNWGKNEVETPAYASGLAVNFGNDAIPYEISPGSGILFKMKIHIQNTAINGPTPLDLVNENDHSPVIQSEYARPDGSTVEPDTIDGVVTISGGVTNHPPSVPTSPNPANHAASVPITTDLSWAASTDPDAGDTVSYDVYFGTVNPPVTKVSNHQAGTTYVIPGDLSYSTPYYWKIVAFDNHGASNTSAIWDFTTAAAPANNPPNVPSAPSPANHATSVSINADLSWTGGDPDAGDTVTYDVYFGTSTPPITKVSSNQSTTTYDPGTMAYSTPYYWKIVAWDNHGASTAGPIWDFTTEAQAQPTPDLDVTGTLSWTKVKPGATVTGSLTVKNIGEAGSKLDWEVASYPSWGTWTFTPSSGTDLAAGSSTTVQVTVVAPDEKNQNFTGDVKFVNSENSGDFVIIHVSLVTPKNKALALHFLDLLFERFPMLKQLLLRLPIVSKLMGL
jgi:hypothetical protein